MHQGGHGGTVCCLKLRSPRRDGPDGSPGSNSLRARAPAREGKRQLNRSLLSPGCQRLVRGQVLIEITYGNGAKGHGRHSQKWV